VGCLNEQLRVRRKARGELETASAIIFVSPLELTARFNLIHQMAPCLDVSLRFLQQLPVVVLSSLQAQLHTYDCMVSG